MLHFLIYFWFQAARPLFTVPTCLFLHWKHIDDVDIILLNSNSVDLIKKNLKHEQDKKKSQLRAILRDKYTNTE